MMVRAALADTLAVRISLSVVGDLSTRLGPRVCASLSVYGGMVATFLPVLERE
jgi:hypothetical protein